MDTTIVTKSALMDAIAHGLARECFEHSIQGWFDVTTMRQTARTVCTLTLVDLGQIVPNVLSSRVVERARVEEMKQEIVTTPPSEESRYRDDPGMLVEYATPGKNPDGVEHTWIDGSHRALALHELGYTRMYCYIVPEAAILRPPEGFGKIPGLDWGDRFENGKIIKRT